MTGEAAAIRLHEVTKSYRRGRQQVPVFARLSLAIPGGDFVAIMGPSGSGKTTLLNLLGGLDMADSGEIFVFGETLTGLGEAALTRWRARTVGFVFQFYNLMPTLTAAENIELPLLLTRDSRARRREKVRAALELVDMVDRASHRPAELSGGQQQRIAIARALVTDPALIVADEPTGDLDRTNGGEILDLLQLLNREMGKTIVMVTHDPLAARSARRVLLLDKGCFTQVERAAA